MADAQVTTIALSDGVSLIALVVAINASVSAVFLWATSLSKKKLKKNIALLEKHVDYTKRVMDSLSDVVIETDSRLHYLEGVLSRAVHNVMEKDMYDRAMEVISHNRFKVLKANHEMLLNSPNKEHRKSAFIYLSNSAGDLKSMEKMTNSLKSDDSDRELLKVYVKILRRKLNS